jgi:hypothetical protein
MTSVSCLLAPSFMASTALHALLSLQAVYWARLAQVHLRANNVSAAKQVFSRSMLSCLSMDVWMTYLQFIKQVQSLWPKARAFELM